MFLPAISRGPQGLGTTVRARLCGQVVVPAPKGPALPPPPTQVIHVTGRLRARALGLVALGHTLPPAPLAELPLHGHMIVFRLSLGLTILACESRYRGWGQRWADGGARERGRGGESKRPGVRRLRPWGDAGGEKAAEDRL